MIPEQVKWVKEKINLNLIRNGYVESTTERDSLKEKALKLLDQVIKYGAKSDPYVYKPRIK